MVSAGCAPQLQFGGVCTPTRRGLHSNPSVLGRKVARERRVGVGRAPSWSWSWSWPTGPVGLACGPALGVRPTLRRRRRRGSVVALWGLSYRRIHMIV